MPTEGGVTSPSLSILRQFALTKYLTLKGYHGIREWEKHKEYFDLLTNYQLQ